METYDSKTSSWVGLWWHPECNGYTSAAINLSELRKFKGNVRLYVRKNKYYEKDSNKPNYNFCIKDCNAEVFQDIEVYDEPKEETFTYDEVQKIINLVAVDIGGSSEYGEHLVRDYIWQL